MVIRDQRPVEMTVLEVLRANTEQLVDLLKRELELKQAKLELELHAEEAWSACSSSTGSTSGWRRRRPPSRWFADAEGFKPLARSCAAS